MVGCGMPLWVGNSLLSARQVGRRSFVTVNNVCAHFGCWYLPQVGQSVGGGLWGRTARACGFPGAGFNLSFFFLIQRKNQGEFVYSLHITHDLHARMRAHAAEGRQFIHCLTCASAFLQSTCSRSCTLLICAPVPFTHSSRHLIVSTLSQVGSCLSPR
jgi:hypothetical protein